ncbi:MAG: hypothetical protein O2856_00835 [Planctomycetota bacterium]|nr:hypothetical protein [Planctomycetota bacterium]
MFRSSKCFFLGVMMLIAVFSTIGCTEEVSSSGEKPAASGEPSGGSGSAAPKEGSGSR